MLGEAAQFVVPPIADVFHLMRVNADRGVDVGMAIGERDGGPAGGEIATDRHERTNPRLARPLNCRFAVSIVASVVQMGMGIDEHADRLRPASDETVKPVRQVG
jgi:hypothetical protein